VSAISRQPSAKNQLPTIRSRVRKGDIAESLFAARALRYGLNVCKAVGQDCRYDFTVEMRGVVRRVQVRSVWGKAKHGGHAVRMCHMRWGRDQKYGRDELDFFAVYVGQADAWYVIPAHAVGVGSISVFPQQRNTRGQWERYREAWHLLLPRGVYVGDIQACADPNAKPFTAEDAENAEEEICSLCRP
jgi:PD-(D/E)XK endonuclease